MNQPNQGDLATITANINGALDLSSQPTRRQARRSSDPVGLTGAASAPQPFVRSNDGSRWLPGPNEQSHRTGSIHPSMNTQDHPTEAPIQQHACSMQACSLAKVFETTELLELVLNELDTQDVLRLRATSRRWNTTVHSSPLLRLHFFTYPQWQRPSPQYQLLPLNLPGLTIAQDESIHLGQWISVTLTSETARQLCPGPQNRVRARSIFEGLRGGLGRNANDAWPATSSATNPTGTMRYDDLQIVQPPLLGMQAFIVDHIAEPAATTSEPATRIRRDLDSTSSSETAARAKVSCDSGITLRFLAETAQNLLVRQEGGPSNVLERKVMFKAIVSFCQPEASPRRRGGRSSKTVTWIG